MTNAGCSEKLDAWSLNEKGQWSLPELKAAYLDDTKPMD